MAELAAVDSLRRERQRAGWDQADRIGVGQIAGVDRRRQDVEADLHRRRFAPTLMKRHGNVRSIQVRHDVRAGGVDGGRCLHPDRLRKSAIVPPVGQAPRHDVLARPPGRIVDADGNEVDVIGDQGVGHIKGKWRGAALVVTEVVAVHPDVRDVIGRSEFQRDGLVLPVRRHIEILPVPGAAPAGRGRRIVGARYIDGWPVCVVVAWLVAAAGVRHDPLERVWPRG